MTRPALLLLLDEANAWRARLLELLQALAEDEAYARARTALREQEKRPARSAKPARPH